MKFVLAVSLLASLIMMHPPCVRGDDLPDFDQLWDYNAPDSTEARLRDLLPAARVAGQPDYLAQLLSQIARSQGLQRRFDDAYATLDEAEQLLGDDTPIARVRVLMERGRVFNSAKQPERGAELFEQALAAAEQAGDDGYAVDAAHMIAITKKDEESLEWNLKALAMAEQSDAPRATRWLGPLYNNIGWTYHDMGEHERALELFEKALVWRREKGQEDETRIAKWCVARELRSLDRTAEALAIQEELLAEWEAAGSRDGYVHEEIAECLLILDRGEEAGAHFAIAYAELSQDAWLVDGEPERVERLRRLGEVAESSESQ